MGFGGSCFLVFARGLDANQFLTTLPVLFFKKCLGSADRAGFWDESSPDGGLATGVSVAAVEAPPAFAGAFH
jgi:hypothetical protein